MKSIVLNIFSIEEQNGHIGGLQAAPPKAVQPKHSSGRLLADIFLLSKNSSSIISDRHLHIS